MNELGLLSVYAASSVFSTDSVYVQGSSPIKDKQADSAEKISTSQAETDINDEAVISNAAKNLLATEQTDNQNQTATQDKADSESAQTTVTQDTQDPQKAELPAQKSEDSAETEDSTETKETKQEQDTQKAAQGEEELTQAEKQQVAKLQAADTEVKAHEQAHLASAGGLNASAPSFEYQTGPDGKKYAVAGEVSVSASKSSNPEDNLKKAEQLKRAALAPAKPSAQDKSVARNADQMIMEAQQEIAAERQEQTKETQQTSSTSDTSEPTDKPGTEEVTGTVAKNENSNTQQSPLEAAKATTKAVPQQNPLDNTTITSIIYAA